MNLNKKRLLGAFITYWVTAYILLFLGGILILYGFLKIDLCGMFLFRLFCIAVLFLLSIILLKINSIKPNLNIYGLSKDKIAEGLIIGGIVGAPFIIMNLIFLILILVTENNIEIYATYALPGWLQTISMNLVPPSAIAFWFLNSLMFILFLQAFSYEVLSSTVNEKYALLAIFLLCAGFYNGVAFSIMLGLPLGVTIGGEVIDIVYLCLVFLYAYVKARNCLGLILAYVFAYEVPVKAAILLGWGVYSLFTISIITLVWALVSVAMYVKKF